MGLSSPDLLGHYTWVDGELLSWNNWASTNGQTGVQWPCVSVAASGQWEAMDCDQMLPFICEYSLNGELGSIVGNLPGLVLRQGFVFAACAFLSSCPLGPNEFV